MTGWTDPGPLLGDWEDLDASDAPGARDAALGARLAENVLDAARRRRTRRAGWLAAAAVVIAAGITIPLMTGAGSTPAPAAALNREAAGRGGPSAADATAIYLAALRGTGRAADVYVADAVPGAVRRQLRVQLGVRLHFGSRPANPVSTDAPSLVVLAGLHVARESATVRREVLCGPGCGTGVTVRLVARGAAWRVTATTPDWSTAFSRSRASSGRASSSSTTGPG